MVKYFAVASLACIAYCSMAQSQMTPELLWKLGRVTGLGVSRDGKFVLYSVSTPNAAENRSSRQSFAVPVDGGQPILISKPDSLLINKNISPDGKYMLSNAEVKLKNFTGKDYYPALDKSNVYVINDLMYRHWDVWEDGNMDHVFFAPVSNPKDTKDIMNGQPYESPMKPFDGDEDYIWNPDSKHIVYVTKASYGKDYTLSTNSDLFSYDIESGQTKNLTTGMMGYDRNPLYNKNGDLAWLSMKRDGFEADKQDIIVSGVGGKINLTGSHDEIHVQGFKWADDGKSIFFWAPIDGTEQLFSVSYPGVTKMMPVLKQITKGDFDITGIIGQAGNKLIVGRQDMNHATEIFSVDIASGNISQITHVNDATYSSLKLSRTERRFVTTTDGKQMLVWVIYPPGFDKSKKYPTLLYCQGGPQSALTQYYSFRWNFQLMASQGYIIVAPNRRGMPGHGTKWNEEISKDHGGQAIRDYLSAIDAMSKESFVDKQRLGCVGASYGGYSVYMLAGIHHKRFKSFIAHDGIFDMRSMYGTTEEIWFVDWDWGGPYWDKKNAAAQKSYNQYNPINYVDKWDTPIMIVQGGRDYRVPVEQGLQAFTAARLRGIKSKMLYLPDENHWVLSAQNALVWQHEFFKWLEETLK